MTASGGLASGTGALGFLDTADFRVTEDGEVVIPQIADGYKELLEIMVRWWDKGLIDHDSLSMSDDALRQKALNGKAGIVFASGTGATNIITDASNEKNGANWVGLSYPRTAEGEPTSMICHQYGKSTGYHATGVFITSTGEYPGTNRLEITGDKGKIVLENSTLKWWELEMSERDFCFTSDKSTPKIDCNYQEFTMTEKETAHIGILQNFTNAILNGEKLISPGEDGIHELMLSNAAYLSEWTGNQEVILPVDGKKFDSLLKEKCVHSLLSKDGEETNDSAGESMARWQVRW